MVICEVPSETIEEGRGRCAEWAFMRLKDCVVDIDVENGSGGVGGEVMSEDGAELSLDEGSEVDDDVL